MTRLTTHLRNPVLLFGLYGVALAVIAVAQSATVALSILAMGLISAVMAMGINMQWGFAGLLNVGAMGFAAVGGAAAVWTAAPPVPRAWEAGGADLGVAAAIVLAVIGSVVVMRRLLARHAMLATLLSVPVIVLGYLAARHHFVAGTAAIEAIDPSRIGYLGGAGAPILLSWGAGALAAAGIAWLVGKLTLGLRADYLAIATLGIAEIVVAVLKNEDWLTRGVKNVVGLPRPVPDEIALAGSASVLRLSEFLGVAPDHLAAILTRVAYCALFLAVAAVILILAEIALRAPWGRMIRAVRDNEVAAAAMGKDVTRLHLRVFIIGSAVVGLAGAMLVTLDGQFTPGTYNPMRFTFLVWVMVILGGSGSNWGAILGGCLVWLFWIEAEPLGNWLVATLSGFLDDGSPIRRSLVDNAAQMRLAVMGTLLILVVRFAPAGLIPARRNTR